MPDLLPDDAPDSLVVMQSVSKEQVPNSALGRAFQSSFDKDPIKFVEKMIALETAYWSGKREGGGVWDGKGACPVCKREADVDVGTATAIGVAEAWLSGRTEG